MRSESFQFWYQTGIAVKNYVGALVRSNPLAPMRL